MKKFGIVILMLFIAYVACWLITENYIWIDVSYRIYEILDAMVAIGYLLFTVFIFGNTTTSGIYTVKELYNDGNCYY